MTTEVWSVCTVDVSTTRMPMDIEKYDRLVCVCDCESTEGVPISDTYIKQLIDESGVLYLPRHFADIPYLPTRNKSAIFKDYVYGRCICLKRELFEKHEAMKAVRPTAFESTALESVMRRVGEQMLHLYIEMHILSGYECTDEMIMDIHRYDVTRI